MREGTARAAEKVENRTVTAVQCTCKSVEVQKHNFKLHSSIQIIDHVVETRSYVCMFIQLLVT